MSATRAEHANRFVSTSAPAACGEVMRIVSRSQKKCGV